MQFEELTVHTNSLGAELVGGVFVGAGVSCYVTEDFQDLQDVISEKSIPYDYIEDTLLTDTGETRLKAYLPFNEQGRLQKDGILEGVRQLKERGEFDLGSLDVTVSTVDEADWADSWKQYFHPLEIGTRFTVKPTWEPYDNPGRIVLEIDPASSFGTGQHETTALCLEELENENLDGRELLDMGCGSGILGIAAALLGAKRVVGVDIEQTAADTARENARINGIPESVLQTRCGNVLTDRELREAILKPDSYDYIAANIVADVIIAMLPLFRSCLRSGGRLICSGILSTRLDAVRDGLVRNGFSVLSAREKNDWAVLTAEKPV